MTREQSQKIQEVERIIDYLCSKEKEMTPPCLQAIQPLTQKIRGVVSSNDDYCKDVEAFNTKVHDYALGLLNELKDKYLKIYAEL